MKKVKVGTNRFNFELATNELLAAINSNISVLIK
jgi:hypothetical protein